MARVPQHVSDLIEALPKAQTDDQIKTSKDFGAMMSNGFFGVKDSIARPLDDALGADASLQGKIVDLWTNDAKGLGAALPAIQQNPANVGTILNDLYNHNHPNASASTTGASSKTKASPASPPKIQQAPDSDDPLNAVMSMAEKGDFAGIFKLLMDNVGDLLKGLPGGDMIAGFMGKMFEKIESFFSNDTPVTTASATLPNASPPPPAAAPATKPSTPVVHNEAAAPPVAKPPEKPVNKADSAPSPDIPTTARNGNRASLRTQTVAELPQETGSIPTRIAPVDQPAPPVNNFLTIPYPETNTLLAKQQSNVKASLSTRTASAPGVAAGR